MRFKNLQKKIKKNSNIIHLFHEAFAIQMQLRNNGYELIYVDEFSYSLRK